MSVLESNTEERALPSSAAIDYAAAEGLTPREEEESTWRQWMSVALGLTALFALLATAVAIVALAELAGSEGSSVVEKKAPAAAAAATPAATPTLAQAKGVEFEPFERVNPNLPAVPAGPV